MAIDAVILAAGNGSRLSGVAATGHKPLLVINGESLIVRLARQAAAVANSTTIVVSPYNAMPICELVGDGVNYVVQPRAVGPGDALVRALATVKSDEVLVLMGDNLMDQRDVEAIGAAVEPLAIGVRWLDAAAALRFTRVSCWDGQLVTEEGPDVFRTDIWQDEAGIQYQVWCGPFKAPVEALKRALYRIKLQDDDWKIGPALGYIDQTAFRLIDMDVLDIGTKESLV